MSLAEFLPEVLHLLPHPLAARGLPLPWAHPRSPCDLALVIVEARYERIHAALMLAATACALGQSVVLFGMGAGVAAFTAGWDGLEDAEHEDWRTAAGVAGLSDLRTALLEMDATLMVCDSGVKTMGLSAADLAEGVAVVGLPTFLDRAGAARVTVF